MSTSEGDPISDQDRAEIHELIALYSFTWDAADVDGFANLFVDDADCYFYLNGSSKPATELHGREAMRRAAIDRAGHFKKIGLVTKHLMPNTVVTAIDSMNAKALTQALITWQMLSKDSVPHPVQAGYYESVVTKTDAGWKFRRRDIRLNGIFKVKEVFG